MKKTKSKPKFWRLILLSGMLSFSTQASAKKPKCDPENPRHCVVELQPGDEAPYRGDLYTIPLSADISIKAHGCEKRIKEGVRYEKALNKVILKAAGEISAAESEAAHDRGVLEGYQRGRESHEPSFFEHPVFVSVVTGVVLVATFFGVKAGATAIDKAFQ